MSHTSDIKVYQGDCLDILKGLTPSSVNLAYLDPPFLTMKSHHLSNRRRNREFSFDDSWASISEYSNYLGARIEQVYKVVSDTGSIFVHCDRNATHIVRGLLDEIFGAKMFKSEIIWYYRRWSNSSKRLLPAHQTIYYYTKSDEYTFNTIWQDYSPATNVDQILQQRSRDKFGKSMYKTDIFGRVVFGSDKPGVPLSDVWDIPYLNPKARERTGFPTQKPVLLLERIITLATNEGDTVLDPFCGSGTTLVAAMLLGRRAIGIDIEKDAVALTNERLMDPIRSDSRLIQNGRDSYRKTDESLLKVLYGLEHVTVQRNSGIDAIAKRGIYGSPVTIRIQRQDESLRIAAQKLVDASKSKNASMMFLVATKEVDQFGFEDLLPEGVVVVNSAGLSIEEHLSKKKSELARL